MVCAFFLIQHHHSTPMENHRSYTHNTQHSNLYPIFPSSSFLLMFLSFLQFLLFLFPFCCCSTSFWFCFFFLFIYILLFFRGEIIHQFLFSLHSCANNDRKKLLSGCRLPVFKFNGFLCSVGKENFSHWGIGKLFRKLDKVGFAAWRFFRFNWSLRSRKTKLFVQERKKKRKAKKAEKKRRKILC